MILEKFLLNPLENNNFLLIDEESKEAVLIDASTPSALIDAKIEEHGAKLKYILLTHGHFDHIMGVNYYREKYSAKVLLSEADKELFNSVDEWAKNFGINGAEPQHVDEFIKDGDIIKIGNKEIKVIATPGHTKGGVCYLIGKKLFTGDTLFKLSVGRVDLPGGSFQELEASIKEKLFTLDENITVYPGHGPFSTVGYEKNNNQFL